MSHIALLGTGRLGEAIGQRLLMQGHKLHVWNRTPDRCQALIGSGALHLESLSDLPPACQQIITVLRDGSVTKDVVEQLGPLRNRCLIPMGTMGPSECRDLACRVERQGGNLLEAPVLGSRPQALNGTLLIMAGGDHELFVQHTPLLIHLSEQPVHVGPVGSGATCKLALNQLIASLTHAFSVSLRLIQQSGVDVETFMQILRPSALYAPTFDKKLQRMLDAHYSDPNFSTSLLRKDLNLFLMEAITAKINTTGLQSLMDLMEQSRGSNLDDMDYCALHELTNSDNYQTIKSQDQST